MTQSTNTFVNKFAGWTSIVSLLLFASALVAHLSNSIHPRFPNRHYAINSQIGLINREPLVFENFVDPAPTWRNRLAFPYATLALSRATGMPFSRAYTIMRMATAFCALAAFAILLRCTFLNNGLQAALGSVVLGFFLVPCSLHMYEIPSDFLDAATFALLVLFCVKKHRVGFAAVLLLSALNRESTVFGVIYWSTVHAWPVRRETLRELAYLAAVGLAGVLVVTWLRAANAVNVGAMQPDLMSAAAQPRMALAVHWRMLRDFLSFPYYGNPLFFLFGYLAIFVPLFLRYRARLSPEERRLLFGAALVYVVCVIFGNINELRIAIPAIVACVYGLLRIVRSSGDGETASVHS